MNNQEFKKAVESLKKIGLTAEEKRVMLARIFSAPVDAKKPVKSYWTVYSFGSWINRNRWSYVVAIVLIISLGGSGVAFAAEGSLPGDALYPVKINVVEPLQTNLALSAQAKAALAASFALERMREGEALVSQGRLTETNQTELSALIAAHTEALNSDLAAVASSDPKEAGTISKNFQTQMNAYAEALDTLAGTSTASVVSTAAASSSVAVHQHVENDFKNFRNQGSSTPGSESSGAYFRRPSEASSSASSSAQYSGQNSEQSHENFQSGNGQNNPQGNDFGFASTSRSQILNLAASGRASSSQVSFWNNHGNDGNGGGENGNSGNNGGGNNNDNSGNNPHAPNSKQIDTRHF